MREPAGSSFIFFATAANDAPVDIPTNNPSFCGKYKNIYFVFQIQFIYVYLEYNSIFT